MARHRQADLENLEAVDWSNDHGYQTLVQQRETLQQRLKGLPAALQAAHDDLQEAQRAIERERQSLRQGGGDLGALQEARLALLRAQERHQGLLGEEEAGHTALAPLQEEINALARRLRHELAAELRRRYAESASEFLALLPEFQRLHERLRAIHNAATRNFPRRVVGPYPRPHPRPELDDTSVPDGQNLLPWLMVRELFVSPQGSRLQRLQDDIARYLEQQP